MRTSELIISIWLAVVLAGCASAPVSRPAPVPLVAPTQWHAPLPHNGKLSVPLFDGGQRDAAVMAALARYDEALAIYQGKVRQAVRETEEALVSLQATAARVGDAQVAEAGYREWLQATEARYKGGLASLVELEDARRTRLSSQDALVGLRLERIQAWIALYRAAGGGWKALAVDEQP